MDGVAAARACSWAPDPGGGGGALELTGVEISEVFTVSPKRGAANATLEALAQIFTTPRKPRNVALTAWVSGEADAGTGGAPRYLVGELVSAEVGPAELRLRLLMSAAQASAANDPEAEFQAASCSLFLDPAPANNMARIKIKAANCRSKCPAFIAPRRKCFRKCNRPCKALNISC